MAAGDVFTFDGSGLSTRQKLAVAAALACKPCCGGGSGSGQHDIGSGSGNYSSPDHGCGCDWAALALPKLRCTATLDCTGDTVTFDLNAISSGCVTWGGSGSTGAGGFATADNCDGSITVVPASARFTVSVEIACVLCRLSEDCLADTTMWVLNCSFTSITGGVARNGLTLPLPYTSRILLLGCSPVIYAQKRIDFVCTPSAPPDPRNFYEACADGPGDIYLDPANAGKWTDTGFTTTNDSVGCVLTIDISE